VTTTTLTAPELEALVAQVVRAELRRLGLRPPAPPGLGCWRWSAEADEWQPVGGPETAQDAPADADPCLPLP
jgi:hypothetical protein